MVPQYDIHAAIARLGALLRQGQREAIVLERLAYGAGVTRWYRCRNQADLDAIMEELSPGSCVSFYLDSRISAQVYSPQTHDKILQIIRRTGDAVVGQIEADGLHLDMEVVSGPNDLREYAETLGSASRVYFGPFPSRDNDGYNAITVTLPDEDGVVRAHPH
jgi:hypothetical protein